jgi:myo-inositol-1(or 4)-monophosphatase
MATKAKKDSVKKSAVKLKAAKPATKPKVAKKPVSRPPKGKIPKSVVPKSATKSDTNPAKVKVKPAAVKNAPVARAAQTVAKTKKASSLKASPLKAVASKKPVATKPSAPQKAVPAAKQAVKLGAKVTKAAKAPEVKAAPAAAVAVPAAKSAPKPVDIRQKSKLLPREFMVALGEAIRVAVVQPIREARGREIVGSAASGDTTFELDRIAEKALLAFLKNARLPVAYYSESAGYTTFTNTQPQNLLVIDPIDGTRAAKSGFESCAISMASTRVIERPVMAEMDNAVVMEIIGNRVFYAERGRGLRITQDGNHVKRFKLRKVHSLETLCWSMTVPARPAELIFPTAAKLIDLTSLKGGFFACNSTSYSLTRLVTNQLDACVDVANRYIRDIPYLVKDHFINAGRGVILGVEPYDLAASLLIAEEAGCTVTDAYGKKFDDVLVLDTSVENQRSVIAAADPDIHQKLVQFFEGRIRQYEDLLRRRAEHAAAINRT